MRYLRTAASLPPDSLQFCQLGAHAYYAGVDAFAGTNYGHLENRSDCQLPCVTIMGDPKNNMTIEEMNGYVH